jgi:tetratricopeptide (TPR) repeat protein
MKATEWIYLLVGVVLAVAASALTGLTATSRAETIAAPAGAPGDEATARLERTMAELETRLGELELALASARGGGTVAAGSSRVALDGVDAAVARWMLENAPGLAGDVDTARAARLAEETAAIELAVDRILSDDFEGSAQDFWMELRETGRLDGVIAQLEELVEAAPHDPEMHVDLAGAYVQKLFDVGPGPMQVVFAEKAEDTFGRALELDSEHWGARFGRAMTLSNTPAFLGRAPAAIHDFEVLIEQQERRPTEPRFAQTYFFLGNMYEDAGETEKAVSTWRRGAELFPEYDGIAEQLAQFEKGGM